MIRGLIILFTFIFLSILIEIELDDFFLNTIYTVSGIMFSVGFGLIVTFQISGVKNKVYISDIRKNINRVRNSFLIYFVISTFCFICDYYFRHKKVNILKLNYDNINVQFDFSILFSLLMLYSIIYYVFNFIEIQKLNNDIYDKTNI